MSAPGTEVVVRLSWWGYATAAPGLVACRTPTIDAAHGGVLDWQLTHAPTGAAVAYFDGPEQAQAAAARLTDIDWIGWPPDERLRALDAVKCVLCDLGGTLALRYGARRVAYNPRAADEWSAS